MRGGWHVVGGSAVALSLGLGSQGVMAQCPTSVVGFGAGEAGEAGDVFDLGQSTTPALDTEVVQISGGVFHTAAVLADGTVVCWGSNAFGWPSGLGRVFGTDASGAPIASGTIGQRVQHLGATLTGIAEVRGGELHTVARRMDGSVVAWGNNDWGQLNVPAGLLATKIDAGSLHSLALTPSGGVVCWGACAGVPKAAASGMADLAAGYQHSLAWNASGALLAWGRNDFGQSTVPSELPATKQAAGGVYSTLALGFDGVVRAWGGNDRGQCGGSNADGSIDTSGGTHLRVVRILGQPLVNAVAISSGGGYHGMALRADGNVVAWGAAPLFNTAQGQTAVPPATAGRSVAIDAGYVHSYIQTTTASADCDANGVIDCVELALVDGADADGDGALDACQTIQVPGDFKTIQAAIDSVPAGVVRTILVAPGTYAPFSFGGKPITVESTGGAANTTINASGLSTSAAIFGAGSTMQTTLRGFTVHPGAGSSFDPSYPWQLGGGGCFLLAGSGTIEDCRFVGSGGGGYGGGVWSADGSLAIRRCSFESIAVAHYGGAISVQPGVSTETVPGEADGTRVVIEDCTIRSCSSYNVGGIDVRLFRRDYSGNMNGTVVIRRSDFEGNSASVHGRDILAAGTNGKDPSAVVRVEDCVFRSPGTVVKMGYYDGAGGGNMEVDGCVIAASGGAICRTNGRLSLSNSWFCDGSISVDGTWNDLGGNSATCPPALDCNGNGVEDFYEIVLGRLADSNGDFVADDCNFVSVPGNYPTIQAAIDATPAGTARTIVVAAGTYNEGFSLNGKNVVVRGAPNNATILDGTGLTASIARFSGGEPATAGIENLVLRNGTAGSLIFPKASFRVGGGLYAANSSAYIKNCRFESNRSNFGGGAYLYRSSTSVEGCQFVANTATNEGGALQLFESSGPIASSAFTGNSAGPAGVGAASALKVVGARTAGGTVLVSNCTIQAGIGGNDAAAVEMFENAGSGGTAGILRIVNTVISGNSAMTGAGGLRVVGSQSSCVLTGGTSICSNLPRNVSGPFLIEGGATVCDCLSDLTLDNAVNGADLGVVLAAWGAASSNGAGDANRDGFVNGADLAQILAAWGACQ